MKALSLTDLIKILGTPEKQAMDTLMYACKQASVFIKSQEMIYKKGAEFAALLTKVSNVGFVTEAGDASPEASLTEEKDPRPPKSDNAPTPGGMNLYVTGIRPVRGQGEKFNMLEAIRLLRDASGELNSAPRMTLQKAKEILENLELGDQSTFIRTFKLPDEAAESVKDLGAIGVLAELRK